MIADLRKDFATFKDEHKSQIKELNESLKILYLQFDFANYRTISFREKLVVLQKKMKELSKIIGVLVKGIFAEEFNNIEVVDDPQEISALMTDITIVTMESLQDYNETIREIKSIITEYQQEFINTVVEQRPNAMLPLIQFAFCTLGRWVELKVDFLQNCMHMITMKGFRS